MARCAYCLAPLLNPRAPDVLRVRLDNGRFGMVELCWHKGADECHIKDPLHLDLADALDATGGHRGPDTEESVAAIFAMYRAIRDRVAATNDPRKLRETIAVLRDTTQRDDNHHRLTLRGPALHWGRNCRIISERPSKKGKTK